jgi:hypothetical protein
LPVRWAGEQAPGLILSLGVSARFALGGDESRAAVTRAGGGRVRPLSAPLPNARKGGAGRSASCGKAAGGVTLVERVVGRVTAPIRGIGKAEPGEGRVAWPRFVPVQAAGRSPP